MNVAVEVESPFRSPPGSSAASVPDALVTVDDLPTPEGEGGGADDLPSARVPPFGTGSPDSSGPEASSKAGISASNPLGGPYWAKSREPLVTRVSSNKPIRTLAALSFSSTNLTMNPNILRTTSRMWVLKPDHYSQLASNAAYRQGSPQYILPGPLTSTYKYLIIHYPIFVHGLSDE